MVIANAKRRTHHGSKVTMARLYPALKDLVAKITNNQNQLSTEIDSSTLTRQLEQYLSAHVYNQFPVRLLALPDMKLIERDAIINHISDKLGSLRHHKNIRAMLDAVQKLAQLPPNANDDPKEDDVREDPLNAVCQFLFSEFGGYAILSHTWLHGKDRDSDILYKDALEKDWPSRYEEEHSGYQKIRKFCDRANRLGFSLAWADTICINKDSSSELDESIRSMYRWYQGSSICITYLGNTSYSESTSMTGDLSSSTKSLYAFLKKDPWFYRGWTLQELLAPKRLKFYDSKWKSICRGNNDKDDTRIQNLVSAVTGIHTQDLVYFDPLKTASSVIERMVWAANRRTTRGEDRAYSLMGIFDVSIPIAYGEGTERAFFRLVEAIITSKDISQIIQLLAWRGKSVSDRIHPSRLIPARLECYLHDSKAPDDTSIVSKSDTSDEKSTSDDTDDDEESSSDTTDADDDDDKIAKACRMIPLASQAIILTHRGLRVRLLLIRIRPSQLLAFGSSETQRGDAVGPWSITFICSGLSLINQTLPGEVKISLKRRHPYRPNKEDFASVCETGDSGAHEFFFGIFTFSEEEGKVTIPSGFLAFLLAVPTSSGKFSMKRLVSHAFQPNCKIDTHEIIQIRNGQSSQNISLDKSKHEDSLKVMTVNL